MRRTNLKAVPNGKPEKLSHDEVTLLVNDIAEVLADELDSHETLDKLLLLVSHVAEFIVADRCYAEGVCLRLAETLHRARAVSVSDAINYAAEYRRRTFGEKGAQA